MKNSILAIIVGIGLVGTACQTISADLTYSEIRQILIQESINSYPGNCPCPYSRASNGSRCGGRSAYSRPGGASPLCYETDVTAQMSARSCSVTQPVKVNNVNTSTRIVFIETTPTAST